MKKWEHESLLFINKLCYIEVVFIYRLKCNEWELESLAFIDRFCYIGVTFNSRFDHKAEKLNYSLTVKEE